MKDFSQINPMAINRPFLVLNHNKKSTQKYTVDIVNKPAKLKKLEDLKISIAERLEGKDFTGAISLLAELKDARSNITSSVSEDLGKRTKCIVRDGRNAIDPPIIAPESYSMMCANHTRGALMLLDNTYERGEITTDQLNNAKKIVQEAAIRFIKDNLSFNEDISTLNINNQNNKKDKETYISKLEEKTKQFNKNIITTLKNNGIKDAKKQLVVAKEFANFKDEHYHVATISKVNEATVIETETMNLGLTEAQKDMFKAIKLCELKNSTDKMKAPGKNMEWFNDQPRWKQDLIYNSADSILSETKVIPTQLRAELPLLRNSYTKTTLLKRKGDDEFKVYFEATHSGTLTIDIPSGKGEDIKTLVNGNIEQLKQFSPTKKVSLNPQTSPNNLKALDKVDVADRDYVEANQNNGVYKSTTAFNGNSRRLPGGGRDLAGFNSIIEMVANKDIKNIEVKKYLKGESSYKKFVLTTEEDKALSSLIEAKRLIDSAAYFKPFDKEHLNSQIAENMAIATSKLQRLHPNWEIPTTNISCASGKDRTQMVIIGASSRAIAQELGIDAKEVTQALSITGSAQHLSGCNGGGTIGCYGQKPATTNAASNILFSESNKNFGQRTADMNKFNTPKSTYLSKFKEMALKYIKLVVNKVFNEAIKNNVIERTKVIKKQNSVSQKPIIYNQVIHPEVTPLKKDINKVNQRL